MIWQAGLDKRHDTTTARNVWNFVFLFCFNRRLSLSLFLLPVLFAPTEKEERRILMCF